MINKKIVGELLLFSITLISWKCEVASQELKWSDVYYTSGSWNGGRKPWDDTNVYKKTQFLELHYKAIKYYSANMGKLKEELDPEISAPRFFVNSDRVTPFTLYHLYRVYGDFGKAAEIAYKQWVDSNGKLEMENAEAQADGYVLGAFYEAGMYKEALQFYHIAYDNFMKWLAISTDTELLKTNFTEYKQNWPEYAESYQKFMQGWKETKRLAKTSKPKPLDPAVQHHEWFYSGKQTEVLKALKYYHDNKVSFMLEKALTHKDPVIAAKAKNAARRMKTAN